MADTKISGMTAKTTPVAADIVPILDSAASNANKRTTVGGLTAAALSGATSSYGGSPTYRWTFSIPDTTDGAAKYGEAVPWTIECGYSDFVGQTYTDPVMAVGYNMDFALGKKDTNEPSVGYWVEADYWDAAISARTSELYCQYFDTASTAQIRPWFYQINRSTHRVVAAHIQVPAANPLTFNLSDGTTTGAGPLFAISRNAIDLYADNTGAPAVFQVRGTNAAGSGTQPGVLRLGYGVTTNALQFTLASASIAEASVDGQRWFKAYVVGSGGTRTTNISLGQDNNAALLSVIPGANGWSNLISLEVRRGTQADCEPLVIAENGGTSRVRIDKDWNVEIGVKTAMSTSATNGFPYIPTMAGAPSGTPTAKTGLSPIVFDTTNNRLYIHNGSAWRYATTT
jgi:hypothetical protein